MPGIDKDRFANDSRSTTLVEFSGIGEYTPPPRNVSTRVMRTPHLLRILLTSAFKSQLRRAISSETRQIRSMLNHGGKQNPDHLTIPEPFQGLINLRTALSLDPAPKGMFLGNRGEG